MTAAYLRKEWHRTLNQIKTLDCHHGNCNVCGMQNLGGVEQCELQVGELALFKKTGEWMDVIPLSEIAAPVGAAG